MSRLRARAADPGAELEADLPLRGRMGDYFQLTKPRLNMLVLTSSLIGQTYTDNYLRDPMGVIREVWMLTPFETTLQPDGSLAPATGPTEKLYGG